MLWPWTLTCVLDLHTWPRSGHGEPGGQLFKSNCLAFSALTLLVGHQEEHLACKNECCRGYLYGARCKLLPYDQADATATQSSLAVLKSRLVWPIWCQLVKVVLEKEAIKWVFVFCFVWTKVVVQTYWRRHKLTEVIALPGPLKSRWWQWVVSSLYIKHGKMSIRP